MLLAICNFNQQIWNYYLTHSWLLITSVVSYWSYFDHLNYLEFLTTSSHLQKQRTINFSTQIQNYFLTSFSWAVVTFVVPNLSHSDYLNLPVTVDNKLLAIKKKGQSYFCIFSKQYGITYLPQHPSSSSSFLSINTFCAYIRFSEVVIALLVLTTGGSWQLTSRTEKRRSFEFKSGKGS